MHIDSLFPSKWLRSEHLTGPTIATIVNISLADLEDGRTKPCLHFAETPLGLILNKVNARTIAALYGPETAAWIGKKIGVRVEQVSFKGQMVPGLRVFDPTPATIGQFATPPATTGRPPEGGGRLVTVAMPGGFVSDAKN